MPQHIFSAAAEKSAVIKKILTLLRWNSLGIFLQGQHTEAVVQGAKAASEAPSWTWYYVRDSHILLISKTWKLLTFWVKEISEKTEDLYWEMLSGHTGHPGIEEVIERSWDFLTWLGLLTLKCCQEAIGQRTTEDERKKTKTMVCFPSTASGRKSWPEPRNQVKWVWMAEPEKKSLPRPWTTENCRRNTDIGHRIFYY